MGADLYIGLISGTSVDGVDAVLASFQHQDCQLLASHLQPYPSSLRSAVQALFLPEVNEIDRLGVVDSAVGALFADATAALLGKAGVQASRVKAIGCHGQTIRHRPLAERPFTVQIGNPFLLAEQTGIDVVHDFRRRDMVLGGQGAPLAPLFHRAFMGHDQETRVILNLGGIANITRLPAGRGEPVAFDTGPANGLMDAWIQQVQGATLDRDGAWAESAQADSVLLEQLLDDPYFQLPPPKSTGKELFNLAWVKQQVNLDHYDPAVVQATFMALSYESIARAVALTGGCDRVLACGGGVHNKALMARLSQRMGVPVTSTCEVGFDPDWLEAMAFAWLAHCHLSGVTVDTRPFTGAVKPTILGSRIPGGR